MPGKWAAPPAPAMMAFRPRPAAASAYAEHVVRHAVGGNHARLKADTKLLENLDCVLHGVPIRAGTHDDADLN